jgi:hypothetical protein
MRLAWFCPEPAGAPLPGGEPDALIARLRARHEIDVFSQARAHAFVWQHARRPFDLCVYELADTPAHDFVWAYLFHYPGVLHLRSPSLGRSRTAALVRRRQIADQAAELAFSGADMVRAPAAASRLVVVSDEYLAAALGERYPEARVRTAPVASIDGPPGPAALDPRPELPLRVGVADGPATEAIERALARARAAGTRIEQVPAGPAPEVAARSDAVISIPWPPLAELPSGALTALSAGRAVVVLETEATAGLPALDPQTWQPRDLDPAGPPVVVSLDPRDAEHSLVLALRRLASDGALRRSLGAAAAAWWREHAAPEAAVGRWEAILDEAAALPAPERPPSWPPHLSTDGTERAREILAQLGIDDVVAW